MTRTAIPTFRNASGSINIDRAMLAGREARTDALREFLATARQMIDARLRSFSTISFGPRPRSQR
jgi:hypothetical protein